MHKLTLYSVFAWMAHSYWYISETAKSRKTIVITDISFYIGYTNCKNVVVGNAGTVCKHKYHHTISIIKVASLTCISWIRYLMWHISMYISPILSFLKHNTMIQDNINGNNDPKHFWAIVFECQYLSACSSSPTTSSWNRMHV